MIIFLHIIFWSHRVFDGILYVRGSLLICFNCTFHIFLHEKRFLGNELDDRFTHHAVSVSESQKSVFTRVHICPRQNSYCKCLPQGRVWARCQSVCRGSKGELTNTRVVCLSARPSVRLPCLLFTCRFPVGNRLLSGCHRWCIPVGSPPACGRSRQLSWCPE